MKDRQIDGENLKNLVLRLSHWDSKVRQDAYDSLLAAGVPALPYLLPQLAARDPVLRIIALDLCCRLHPKGAREYARRVWLGDKNINVVAALLENLGTYGETVADLCLVTDLVNLFQHPYTSYAGTKAAKMIGRRLGRAAGEETRPVARRPDSWEELVLVVDDSRTARCFYRDILENAGPYRVEEAADGLEGLAMSLKKKRILWGWWRPF